jgi:hypothetical protein
MKNRSKILSPRDTQIRRELSNSAEFAASGFSAIYSSAKSQLKKVVSKLSGACSTAMTLIFPNPEITVQDRDLYSFNLKLNSISETIKNPLPGPKPLHMDSYTMPPTPGRFLTNEDSGNKREKILKHELRVEMITKPEYGVPVWKQLSNFSGSKDKNIIQTNEKNKNCGDSAPGSEGLRKVKENPNSTPIRPAEKGLIKQNVFLRTAGSDPDKKTPTFFENSRLLRSDDREKENFERKNLDFKEDDADCFSFMDKDDRNEGKDEKNLEQKDSSENHEKGSCEKKTSEKKEKKNDEQLKNGDGKIVENHEVGKSAPSKTNSFFVNDSDKKFEEMEEGFLNSKSTSKNSSPSKKSESEKSSSDLPKPLLDSKPDEDLKKPDDNSNPFLKIAENREKQIYVFGSSSVPFVTRENNSTVSSNPFVPDPKLQQKPENPLKIQEKSEKNAFSSFQSQDSSMKNPFSSNQDSTIKNSAFQTQESIKNPFSSNISNQNPNLSNFSAQNPFSQPSSGGIQSQGLLLFIPNSTPFPSTQNPFSPLFSESVRNEPQFSNSNQIKNQFETSLRNQKSSNIPNPFAQKYSSFDSSGLNYFSRSSEKPTNPFVNKSKIEENKGNLNDLNGFTSHLNQEPKKNRDESKIDEKNVNPFVLPAKEESSQSEATCFTLGVFNTRSASQVKKNNK